jgi:nicotinate-nucleotide pyrophosphorylase
MARYLIEVPHEAEPGECARAVRFFLRSGSHFMTRADWGCKDGVHKAYIIVEVDSREEAKSLVPRVFHEEAEIVKLDKFTMEEIEEVIREHPEKHA